MQIIPAGDKVLIFASGKRVELTEAEYAELEAQFNLLKYVPCYPSYPSYPSYPLNPSYPNPPWSTVTYKSDTTA